MAPISWKLDGFNYDANLQIGIPNIHKTRHQFLISPDFILSNRLIVDDRKILYYYFVLVKEL